MNCTDLNLTQLNHMNLSRGVTALGCVAILLVMLLILCFTKAFATIMQRLFLYLILASLVSEILIACTLEHQVYYEQQEEVCAALGFVTNWSTNVAMLCAVGVITYAMILVCTHTSMKCNRLYNREYSTRCKVLLELYYLISIVLLPCVILWLPLLNDHYGLAVAWCWIRAIDQNCNEFGLVEQISFGFATFFVLTFFSLIMLVWLAHTYWKVSTELKQLLLQILVLTMFVLFFILVYSSALAIRIYSGITKWTQDYGMWIYHGTTLPLAQLIIPLGFFSSFYFKHFRNKCQKLKPRKAGYINLEAAKTVPPSNRESAPSNTYFDVPYTDGFTSVHTDPQGNTFV